MLFNGSLLLNFAFSAFQNPIPGKMAIQLLPAQVIDRYSTGESLLPTSSRWFHGALHGRWAGVEKLYWDFSGNEAQLVGILWNTAELLYISWGWVCRISECELSRHHRAVKGRLVATQVILMLYIAYWYGYIIISHVSMFVPTLSDAYWFRYCDVICCFFQFYSKLNIPKG